MNILIVGNGAREHALLWKLRQSERKPKLFCAPGNAGTRELAENIQAFSTKDIVAWCNLKNPDLVVIGPDQFLAEGIVNQLQAIGISVFGPTKEAGQIESSKSFAKQFMRERNIPTASYEVFTSSADAMNYVKTVTYPVVVKADGLALGKGVVIAHDFDEVKKTIETFIDGQLYGEASSTIVIEEYLQGREFSVHAFSDGTHSVMFPPSKDHKRAFEGNTGPNTGGMGAVAPLDWVSHELMDVIHKMIVRPVIDGLHEMGMPFVGVLYPGIMLTDDGPKVIELNARFGDPEAESYMRLLDTDFIDIMESCIRGNLSHEAVKWRNGYAATVMIASQGYPETWENGKVILGLDRAANMEEVEVFHAGTKEENGNIISRGGRVLGVSAISDSPEKVLGRVYSAIEAIRFEKMYYRKDISFY